MSRSNGPLGQLRGVPPQQWPQSAEADLAVQQAYAAAQAAAQPRQPQTFGNVQGQAPAQGQPQYAPQAPAYPLPPGGAPADQGYYPAPQAPAQHPAYQPVFERYAPPPEPASRGYDLRSAGQHREAPNQAPAYAPAPPRAQSPPQPQPQPSLYDSHARQPQQRGGIYDQWPQPAAPQPAPAARGYDFSNYGAGAPPAANYGHAPAPAPAPQQRQHNQPLQPQHAPPPQDDQQWQFGPAAGRRDEVGGHGGHYGSAQPAAYDQHDLVDDGGAGQLQAATDDHGYDPDDHPDYEDDEPRRGRRGLVMVSALVAAIALGGGLAYAYKTFMKSPGGSAQVAKVAAPKGPSKTQPADPGGKQFANQDSKLQSRLGDGSAPTPVAASPVDVESGVKRVPTVVIGRDGSVSPPSPVPGMVVVQPQPPGPPPVSAQQATVAAAVATAPVAPPQAAPVVVPQPRVAAIAPQPRAPVPVVNAAPVEVIPVAPPPPKKPTVKRAPPPRDDLAATGSAAPVAAVAPARGPSSGFVAVLASKGSKAEAERTNAELEQRFDVLKGKIFDVQEANLTAQGKGIYYRSVVGPPGSREFASGVCNQLKAVGYTGCWITAY